MTPVPVRHLLPSLGRRCDCICPTLYVMTVYCCGTVPPGLASAVVYLVHPSTEPTPDQLEVLWGPLAAGRHVLVAINGPSRVKGLTAAAGGTVAGLSTEDAAGWYGGYHLYSLGLSV